jgi:ATP adenylyltransferase
MEHLHAPWRIEYILAPKTPRGEDLVFKRIADASDDEANLVVLRARSCYALLNSAPYNGGHLMVVPYRQVSDLDELTDDETLELMQVARRCLGALRRAMKADGFNVGLNLGRVAGAGIVEHLHLHIVPRWLGDTNFMPVLADTAVLPQALRDVAGSLRRELAADPLSTGTPGSPSPEPPAERSRRPGDAATLSSP